MAFETIKSKIPIIRDMSPTTGTIALLGLGAAVGYGGYKFGKGRGWFGEIEVFSPGMGGFGRTAQQSRFSRAAKKCKGRRRGAFQSCMSRELGGSGLSGLSGTKRKKSKSKRKKGKGRRKSTKRGGRTTQQNRMKRAAKKCKGKKGRSFKSCMRSALRK
jgi:hypothetical protein